MAGRLLLLLVALLVLAGLAAIWISGNPAWSGAGITGISCGEPFIRSGNLNLEGSPEPGKPVELVYSVESARIGENISLEVVLPEGIRLKSGDLRRAGPVPVGGTVGIRSMVAVETPGDWIITAWAGPAAEPRLSGDVLFISASKEKCLAGKIPLSLTPVREGAGNPRQEYLIAFREYNPRYKTIILMLPGMDFLGDTSYGDQNKPAIRVTAARDQITVIRQLDFVLTAYASPSGAATNSGADSMLVRNILISAALIIVAAVVFWVIAKII
ncbi:MAG: hypothetical protein PHO26_00155 [Dehalococcoidia bacterium]|nr:hypothetical protein [Dehalococcoidia bacterium]MDD5495313.1 hypothetical protein [Dehalococcoidia bacterium]